MVNSGISKNDVSAELTRADTSKKLPRNMSQKYLVNIRCPFSGDNNIRETAIIHGVEAQNLTGDAVQDFKLKFNATLGVSRKLASSVSTLSMYNRVTKYTGPPG